MNNETMNNNKEKILVAFKNKIKIHLVLKTGSWKNGFVTELEENVFTFEDDEDGKKPFFFIEIKDVKPYTEDKKKGKQNDR